jgi:MFS family permease
VIVASMAAMAVPSTDEVSPPTGSPQKREWLAIGLAVAAVGWGANQFAPLLLMYRAELGVSAATVQATYGLYAAGLIPGLLLGGPFSDRYGRRRVLAPALLVSLLASLLLMAGGTGVEWLFAGVASGTAFSSGTAWIKELSLAAPEHNSGARRATVAMTVGFAFGPLIAGLLAQWSSSPALTAYLPHVALTLVSFPLVLRTHETRTPTPGTSLWQPLRLPAASRRRFRNVVVPFAPWVFGTSSIALAYLPGLVREQLGENELVFSAVVTALTMLAGIAVQPLARRVSHPDRPTLLATALAILVTGLLLSAGAAATSQPLLIAVAALVLGAGYGCCLVCGLTEVQALARPDNLARLTAIFQAVAYLGFAVPYVLAVIERVLPTTWLLLAAAVAACLTLVWTTFRAARRAN